jgi:hypothetical protein
MRIEKHRELISNDAPPREALSFLCAFAPLREIKFSQRRKDAKESIR